MPDQNMRKHMPVAIWAGIVAVLLAATLIVQANTPQPDLFSSFAGNVCTVAVVSVEGPLATNRQEGYVDSLPLVQHLQGVASDPRTRGLLLLVDSPGGSPAAAEEIGIELENARIPTVAFVRGAALSGGYWIAAGADRIVALPTSIVGSIGATLSYLEETKLNDQEGYTFQEIVSGDFKEVGNVNKPLSPAGRAYLQSHADTLMALFLAHITESRGFTDDEVKAVADAKFYSAEEAKQLRLIDAVGGMSEARSALESLMEVSPGQAVFCAPARFLPYEKNAAAE